MAFRDSSLQELRVPLSWTAAGAVVVAMLVALGLLLTDHREQLSPTGYGAARNEFDELIEPVAGALAAPVRWTGEAVDYVRGYFFAVSENRRLKREVVELQRWRDAAIALKNVNDRYEALLKLRTEPPIPSVSARVVIDARGPFSNARLADAGAESGIRLGNPVMSEHGVAGRVVGVTHGASRVLLLTDVDSRTPVLVDRTNARAILTGDGGRYPRMDYIRGQAPVRDGDLVLTSGDGGVFPRGLPVGVAARDLKGVWRVRLYAESAPIDYVRVLIFQDFDQLVSPASLSGGGPPPPLTAAEEAEREAALAPRPVPTPAPGVTGASPVGQGAHVVPGAKPAPAVGAATKPASVKPKTVAAALKPRAATVTGTAPATRSAGQKASAAKLALAKTRARVKALAAARLKPPHRPASIDDLLSPRPAPARAPRPTPPSDTGLY